MDEKTMVNDILACVKSDLTAYQTAISETENMQLRQTFQQIRNNDESFKYELYKVANNKGLKEAKVTLEYSLDNSSWTKIGDDVEIDVDTGKPWVLKCDADGIPADRRNLAWKAAEVFFEQIKRTTTGLGESALSINERSPLGKTFKNPNDTGFSRDTGTSNWVLRELKSSPTIFISSSLGVRPLSYERAS